MAHWALSTVFPQAGPVFMIKLPYGWSRCALRTRAGTSAKYSCWTSSMTHSTTAAGSISPLTVRKCFLGIAKGDGLWGLHWRKPLY